MKTHTYILALTLVAFTFNLKAYPEGQKETESQSSKTEILEIVDTEDLSTDECTACPVPVQIFDQDFNLVHTGEMTPLHEMSNKKLKILIGQSNLIMESNTGIIYQLEE